MIRIQSSNSMLSNSSFFTLCFKKIFIFEHMLHAASEGYEELHDKNNEGQNWVV